MSESKIARMVVGGLLTEFYLEIQGPDRDTAALHKDAEIKRLLEAGASITYVNADTMWGGRSWRIQYLAKEEL